MHVQEQYSNELTYTTWYTYTGTSSVVLHCKHAQGQLSNGCLLLGEWDSYRLSWFLSFNSTIVVMGVCADTASTAERTLVEGRSPLDLVFRGPVVEHRTTGTANMTPDSSPAHSFCLGSILSTQALQSASHSWGLFDTVVPAIWVYGWVVLVDS